MIAELDIGNSRCKWRLVSADCIVGRGDGIAELVDQLVLRGPAARARLCSVLSEEKTEVYVDQLRPVIEEPVQIARTTARCGAVVNGYDDPERLGVDRWLAVIAGWHLVRRDILVVDIGSALTIDIVDREGCHRGGYIVPGPSLLTDSLLVRTDRVRFDKRRALTLASFAPGRSTQECVAAGVGAATVGSILAAYQSACDQLQADIEILLCGGHAAQVVELLDRAVSAPCRHVPDLVLDGLRWLMPSPVLPDPGRRAS